MKRINILCEDSKVADAREIASQVLTGPVLRIPVSPTGEAPATHWFCSMAVDEKSHEKLLEIQKNSEITEGAPKQFLIRKGLKVIR